MLKIIIKLKIQQIIYGSERHLLKLDRTTIIGATVMCTNLNNYLCFKNTISRSLVHYLVL